jgi:hypothetical protein
MTHGGFSLHGDKLICHKLGWLFGFGQQIDGGLA